MNHPLLDVAKQALEAAKAELSRGSTAVLATKSSPTDVVTKTDRAVEAAIKAVISAERPHDTVLGEEYGGSEAAAGTTRWIVDPIDGTVNFTYGIPDYAISIAAEIGGVVEVGIVCDFPRNEEFIAVRGQGAELDGRRLAVTAVSTLDQALIGTGFGYDSERRRSQGRIVAELVPEFRDIRRVGAAAIDLCWVACGRLDGYYEAGLKIWDHAAAALIVSEAGGTVDTDLDGFDRGDLVVAAGATLFDPLAKRVLAAHAQLG